MDTKRAVAQALNYVGRVRRWLRSLAPESVSDVPAIRGRRRTKAPAMRSAAKEITPDSAPAPALPQQGSPVIIMNTDPILVRLAGETSDRSWPTTSTAPPVPPARLTVDLARRTVILDGRAHDVKSVMGLRWVKVLAEHPGEWISGADLARHDEELEGTRTDRLRKHLPREVCSLIESDTGKGSRIRL
jgi:hypothetical protein